jgi:hypothetical protein
MERIYIRQAHGYLQCESGVDWDLQGSTALMIGYVYTEEHTPNVLSVALLVDPVISITDGDCPEEEANVVMTTSDGKDHAFHSARQLNAWIGNTFGHLQQPVA